MTQTQEQIEKLKTLQESYDVLTDMVENQLPALNTALQEESAAIQSKIDNIKLPEIDTTNIASKDLERFFGVKPIEGYEFMTPEEVCSTLEDIMTSMDLGLTPEMAAEITSNTLNN